MAEFILSAFADEIDPMLETQMDVLERHGIKYIEMRGVNGKNLIQYSPDEVRKIKRQLDARGFKISSVGSPIGKINITDDFEPHLALFRHTIEIAKILETPYIRMFSFFIPEGQKPESFRDEVMRRWERFVVAAKGSGLTLLHENEKNIYGDTAERCLDLLETMNCGYLKAVFDPANFVQCDVETYPHAFNLLRKYIAYVHVKDALYSNHSVVPSGYGDGKVKDILRELSDGNFEGFLSLEPHLADFVGFGPLERGRQGEKLQKGDGLVKFAIAMEALKKILSAL